MDVIKVQLDDFGDKITKEDSVVFEHLFANVLFGAERYRDALRQINHVLNDNESNLRQDIYSFSKLFNLVVHYELGNFDLLDYLIKSTERFYLKRKKTAEVGYEFEVTFIRSFKKLIKISRSFTKSKAIFASMREELQTLMRDQNEKVALEYFDYITWIDAKLQDRTYGELKRLNKKS
jgi:hypothetical protein